MADKYAPDYGQKLLHVQSFGNAFNLDYAIPGAAAVDDKLYFGLIPAGLRVTQVRGTTGITLGYEPADGDTPVAGTFADLAPITFNRDVKLVGTVTAAVTGGAVVIVTGQVLGAP